MQAGHSQRLFTRLAAIALIGCASASIVEARQNTKGAPLLRFAPGGGGPGGGPGSILPMSGGEGTEVTMQGNFSGLVGSHTAIDVLLTSESDRGFIGTGSALTATSASAVVSDVHSYPESDEPILRFGSGSLISVPTLDGTVFYPEAMWDWSAPHGAPEFLASQAFASAPNYINEPCDGLMPRKIFSQFRLVNGCLRATLPGPQSCIGDQVAFVIEFETQQEQVVIKLGPSTSLAPLPWVNASGYVTWALNFSLPSHGAIASYDFATNEIEICPTDPLNNPIIGVSRKSYLMLIPDPAQYTRFEACVGDSDQFTYDSTSVFDTVQPSAAFGPYAATLAGPHPLRNYDEGGTDKWFYDTLDGFGDDVTDGFIRAAVLELHLIGAGGQTNTDHIRIGWDGSAMQYSTRLEDLIVLSSQWQPSDEATFAMNLNILPGPGGTLVDVLHVFDGGADLLDLIIDDDTIVDYAKLKVWRCNP